MSRARFAFMVCLTLSAGSGLPAAIGGQISVAGEAEVKVTPDQVILTLGVETLDAELAKAKEDHDRRVKAVVAAVRELGVPAADVATDFVEIEPQYDRDWRPSKVVAYFVRRTVVVTLRDLSKFEELLSKSLEAGANHVRGVQFRTADLRKHRDQARALAIKAASEKAEALAKELGARIGAATNINEERDGWWASYGSWWGYRWNQVQTQNVSFAAEAGWAPPDVSTFAPGQIGVRARVAVTFELLTGADGS